MSIESWLLFSGLVFEIVGGIIGAVWALSQLRLTMQNELRKEVDIIRDKTAIAFEANQRIFNDTIEELRKKTTEVELYCRDTFIRRDSFSTTMSQVSADIRSQFLLIATRLERMEAKIDTH